MRFKVYRATIDDLDGLEKKDCYSAGELGPTRGLIELSGRSEDSLCVSFGEEGCVYGIAGSYKNWHGSSQLWAVFGKEVDKHPIALTKICESLIIYAVEKQKLWRVSLTVRSAYTKGNKFAYRLGFDFEGKMHGYLPDGDDANLYARLF